MFKYVLKMLQKPKMLVTNVAMLGLEAHHNYDPKDFQIKGLRNVVIVDSTYLIENHETIAKTLKRSYVEA